MNEKKTEKIVRDKLQELGYYKKGIAVEEQQSDNPKIRKLLESASKKGNGIGYPEFIIQSEKYSELLIVVECKAKTSKHESREHNKYSECAIDGALLYASYLSKEYDVIAMGVSGETKAELRITHYLHLKKSSKPFIFLDNKIHGIDEYYKNYITDDRKFKQDLSELLSYTKDLNDTLHIKKIKESQRSLLISGILIALKDDAFNNSFKKHKTASDLAEDVLNSIKRELKNSNLPIDKMKKLELAYSFITTNTTLITDKVFFENLITEIDGKVNSFIKTHKYFDTLGQFYIEFLRYANNDKGLGIVLTPPHITELFCELAELDSDSVIFDNCCGTCGFLISAMKMMISKANNKDTKIKSIQSKQIIGIEFQDDIYALAVSNMIIHNDGKSNIYIGDSIKDSELNKEIKKKFNPNIGLLNPPYAIKKEDIEEFVFIWHNLEMLQKKGKCIAIVPMSCALAQSGEMLSWKKKLLEHHTLEAVMSMPDELFHNSKVGVVTCVMVFTAHVPHPKGKKTWFGYWKDDGFIKVKNKGRIDLKEKWEEIKKQWVNAYINKEVIAGHSVTNEVSADDEWCAEAYMETDYSEMIQDKFIGVIKNYIAFQFLNN